MSITEQSNANRRARGAVMALALFVVSASPAIAAPVAGTYRLVGEPDTAGELVIRDDGTFAYMLSAGALDETAAGSWTVVGTVMHLKTIPRPVPPSFAAGARARSADARLVIHVAAPNGAGIAGVDLQVGFDAGEPDTGYTQDYGWSLPAAETRTPRWVAFGIEMYQVRSQRFAIAPAGGNDLAFVLTPNDLGVVDFGEVAVDVEPDRLVMHRGAAALPFERMPSRHDPAPLPAREPAPR